jgi:membrane protein CcdC involved in cytochrome C biogenesis
LKQVADERQKARADFRRMMKWILVAAVLMVAGALAYLFATGDLTRDMVIATVLGVFFSVLLGSGLMAASYFSAKSGHDRSVSDATTHHDEGT